MELVSPTFRSCKKEKRCKNMYLSIVYPLSMPTAPRMQHVRLAFELPLLERPRLRKIGPGRGNESFCCDQWDRLDSAAYRWWCHLAFVPS